MGKTLQEKMTLEEDYVVYSGELLRLWRECGRAGVTSLFIGDSFFDSRYFWTNFYTESFPEKQVIAAGIGSTTTYDWMQLASTFLAHTAPKNLVINLGTNNFYDDGDAQPEGEAHLKELFSELHRLLPQTQIYYFAIAQRVDPAYRDEVAETNANMQTWCADKPWITFLSSSFLTAEGMRDGVHPTLESYATYVLKLKEAGFQAE